MTVPTSASQDGTVQAVLEAPIPDTPTPGADSGRESERGDLVDARVAPVRTKEITADLFDRLGKHFAWPDWFYIEQVDVSLHGEGGSEPMRRLVDAFAIANWSSRNHEVNGFEVKASRADWLAELADPQKAEAGAQYCDRWWVCAAPGVVRVPELPSGWGLLLPSRKGLREVVRPALRSPKTPPKKWWIYLLRKVAQKDAPEVVQKAVQEAYDRGEENAKAFAAMKIQRLEDRNKGLVEAIAEFEKASGVKFDDWNSGVIGAAVRVVLEQKEYVRMIGSSFRNIERHSRQLHEALLEAGWEEAKDE